MTKIDPLVGCRITTGESINIVGYIQCRETGEKLHMANMDERSHRSNKEKQSKSDDSPQEQG